MKQQAEGGLGVEAVALMVVIAMVEFVLFGQAVEQRLIH